MYPPKMDAPPLPPAPSLLRQNSQVSKASTQSSKGFRLLEEDHLDTGSIYSIYKQKIDQMFESDSSGQHNTVQARIERMFTEVAQAEGLKTDFNCHSFSIDYLGSISLQEKVTSLIGLQNPLKDLYFTYKKTLKTKDRLTGKLEISPAGLKVRYQGEKGDLEQLNTFPTIAVWSAVKFVLQNNSFAFLPLITDPDNIDKRTLFQTLNDHDSSFIITQSHAPLFTVVMRKIGVNKQLECHAFVCQTSEDAIVIAATLYKSLMNYMKGKHKRPKNKNGLNCISVTSSICTDSIIPVRPPRKKRSTNSSTKSEGSITNLNSIEKPPTIINNIDNKPNDNFDEIVAYEETTSKDDKEVELKRTRSLRKNSNEIMANSGDISGDILTKVTIPRSGSFLNTAGLTRYKSKINRANGLASGGSPLGFNELFTEFRLQENLHSLDEILAAIIDPKGMSYNDLKPIYKEFLLKLAVTLTKDELYQKAKLIMKRKRREKRNIRRNVGVKGIKRIFRKSFRMNLAHKLKKKTKFSSKKFQKHKNLKKNTITIPESTISSSSYDTRQFQPKETNVQKKSNYKKKEANLKNRRDKMSTSEDSDFFTVRRKKNSKCSPNNQNRNSSSGYVSCSECSYDSDTCTCTSADKCYCSLGNKFQSQKPHGPQKARPPTSSSCRSCRSSNEKCYCSKTQSLQSLTWCGCDTDSCTDSNKCYCNTSNTRKILENCQRRISEERTGKRKLKKGEKFDPKNRIFEELKQRGFFPTNEEILNLKKSSKPRTNNNSYNPNCVDCRGCANGTIFQQLQRRGFFPSSEEMTTPPEERKLCKKNSNTRSTKSVEYLHNPTEKYYEKVNGKYEDSRRRSVSDNNLMRESDFLVRSGEVYGRAMSEISPRYGLVQSSVRSVKSYNESHKRNTGKTLQKSIPPTSSTEALSVKKSAEIAALFTDLKLSQTTDITHMLPHYSTITQNSQNPIRPRQFPNPNNNIKSDKKAIVTPYKHITCGKMVPNSLYQGRNQNGGKNGLYSARNGLYTIQSQSDSSCSEHLNNGVKRNINNIENTLGYLP